MTVRADRSADHPGSPGGYVDPVATDVVERIRRVGVDGDHHAVRRAADDVLRATVAYDAGAWASIDPVTLLFTSCDVFAGGEALPHDADREVGLFELEFEGVGPNCYLDLRRRPGRVASLATTVDDIAAVPRVQRLFAAFGLVDEARLLLVDRDTVWGALTLYRTACPFSPGDLRRLAAIGPPVADLFRRSFLHAAAAVPAALDDPPGVLVLDPAGRIVVTSDAAEAWLRRLPPSTIHGTLASLTARLRAEPSAEALVSGEGGAVAFHAAPAKGHDGIAVVVERPRPARLAPVITSAYGLTARESEVTREVLGGASNKHIAARLGLAEHTVEDHLKHIYAKTGTATRGELAARLFTQHYLPMNRNDATPSPYGWYLEG